ncbi:MAG: PIG-L family deacetylase [Phormidesmis sp.]
MKALTETLTETPIESLPLRTAEVAFAACQGAVVLAPHPDDETLGCGGAIALLRQRSIPVHVIVFSDGSASHPQSISHSAPVLSSIREYETYAALNQLGVSKASVTFLRWPDTSVPHPADPGFPLAVSQCAQSIRKYSPSLLFVPWQKDQHCDHRATWEIAQHCLQQLPPQQSPPSQLVYAIWGSAAAGLPALPPTETGWRLDIHTVQALKRRAAMAHQSQTTDLIKDDPTGFRLTPTMLNNLIQPWETYLEAL